MADPSPGSDPTAHAHAESGGGAPPAIPRWVKVSGIVVVILAVLVVVLLLLGHGPGQDSAPGAVDGQSPPVGTAVSLTGSGG